MFLVGYVDYDPSFNFNRQAELEANRDQFIKDLKATLLTSRNLRIDGYSALEFTAELRAKNLQVEGLHGGPPALSNRYWITKGR